MSKREKAKAFLKALIHHDKPEKHEDIHVISQKIYSLQPGNTGSIRHASSATSVGSSRIAIADCQGIPDSDIVPTLPKHTQDETLNKPENVIKLDVIKAENTINPENVRPNPIEPIVHITPYIFEKTLAPQIAKFPLPEVGSRIAGTPQLAYYLSLLPSSLESGTLDETKFNQLQVYLKDPDEKERLQKMARSLVGAFIQDKSKNPDVVAEVVSLAAVLDKDDFRKLLQTLVNGIDHSVLLDVHLLNGLAQLIQNAERGHIDAADLIEILKLLNSRYTHIKDSLSQSSQHAYQLVLTISHVLDSMVDSQVKGLSRETLHEPLSEYLKGLKESPDSFYVYQAAYAYQALQCIPDDETFLKKTIRRTGKVIQGISGVVSAVKGLDLDKFIEGLQNIQGGFAGAEEAFVFVKGAYENVKKLSESGHGLFESLKESFDIAHKCAWYPALRVADKLIQDGRFSDFEKLVRRAACKLDPAFQWGVSQRLGEIAVNIFWDVKVRQCAVTFLGELYKDDATWGQQASIKQWILSILGQLEDPSNEIISNQARELLRELETDGSVEKRLLYQGYKKDGPGLYPMIVSLPPHKSPLLEFVQNKPDVETPLHQLKLERLRSQSKDVYISPIAKSSPRDTEGFDLMTKVEEFLKSNRKVFLILGDSGAGKSTFNRALEISLWDNYKPDSPIPLFISLPTIENPVHGLISKRLKDAKFTDEQILELKNCHDFILICDGYDECQQTRNLYESNMLNQPGGWRVQMVISCRTEYNGVDYKYRFLPTDQNSSGNEDQFEEAIIAPFSRSQIRDYIDQYVLLKKPVWKSEDYRQAFRQVPNLQDLVRNPFLLKLALGVLPEVLETNSRFSAARITRVKLYDRFVGQWIDSAKVRLSRTTESSPQRREKFEQLSNSDFRQHGFNYLKEMAKAIYDNQDGSPVVSYSEHCDRDTWKEALFNKEDKKHLLWEAIPLSRDGNQYQFIHRSILEYGIALVIFDPSEHSDVKEPTPFTPHHESSSSDESSEDEESVETTLTAAKNPLLDSPLGKIKFAGQPSVLQFLSERVQQQPIFKDQLLYVIERSKTDKDRKARIAAANAITILVRAGFQFNGADLRGIKIPGADLSYGVFDSADLEGADLHKVNLRNIWLRGANLTGARMKSVKFGELRFLQEESDVLCCAYSPDGKIYAVGLWGGNINLYETSSWDIIRSLTSCSEGNGVRCLAFSPTSNQVASGVRDFTVQLWDVATGNCAHILKGHTSHVFSVAYSPKGGQIASASDDSTVRLWDAVTGICMHTLQDHTRCVYSAIYSPSGDHITSASRDRTVRVWDVATGKCIRAKWGHMSDVNSVAYSPKGERIASGSKDKTVRLWKAVLLDHDTADCILTLRGHSEEVTSVVFSPKGDRIASGSADKTVRLWDPITGSCIHTLQGHSGGVTHVAYSPKGDQIASGSEDWTVRLWDIDTGDYIHTLRGHSKHITNVVYSPEGGRIASGSLDKTVRLWDVGNCFRTLQGHSDEVTRVLISPKSDQIASGSYDSTVRLWNVNTGDCVSTLWGHSQSVTSVVYSPNEDDLPSENTEESGELRDDGNRDVEDSSDTLQIRSKEITSVAFSPKGYLIASGSCDSTVRLWNIKTGTCHLTLSGHEGLVRSVVFSPNGTQIASGGDDKTVRLWDVNEGKCIHTMKSDSDCVTDIVYSPNRDQIAYGCDDMTVQLWDLDIGECVHTLQGHSKSVTSVIYSPKGDQIATGSVDSTVRLWKVITGDWIRTFQGHSHPVTSVVYSRDGSQIASGSRDRTVRIWDVATGECARTLKGHARSVTCVMYSPNGDRIASGSRDKTVRLWNAVTGDCVHVLKDHSNEVSSVLYSPKGDQIASGSYDKTVWLWDATTGDHIHTLQGHSEKISSFMYSPKGDQIVTGSADETVRLWDLGNFFRASQGRCNEVTCITYSPKGDQIASGSNDSTVRLWDVDSGNCVRTLWGHSGYVTSVVYSPNRDQIASGGDDHTVRLWNVRTGDCIHTFQSQSRCVTNVVYSPDGGQIAYGGHDCTVRLWDVDIGECVYTLEGHSEPVTCVVYSPEGDQIASGSEDLTVRLWNVNTGDWIRALQGHSKSVTCVAYSPNGDQIASGSLDKTVQLWDARLGNGIRTLRGHSGSITSVVYSRDSKQIASGSWNMTKLWSSETGDCLITIPEVNARVKSIAWRNTDGGDYLITGSDDNSVRRWQIINEDGGIKALLRWSSSHEVLAVSNASFSNVKGLSRLDQELLSQRGAVVEMAE